MTVEDLNSWKCATGSLVAYINMKKSTTNCWRAKRKKAKHNKNVKQNEKRATYSDTLCRGRVAWKDFGYRTVEVQWKELRAQQSCDGIKRVCSQANTLNHSSLYTLSYFISNNTLWYLPGTWDNITLCHADKHTRTRTYTNTHAHIHSRMCTHLHASKLTHTQAPANTHARICTL